MEPRFEIMHEKKLIGKMIRMSFSENKTRELWQSFMPQRGRIRNSIGHDLYSAEVYDSSFFEVFSHEREFEKWAAVEVTDYDSVPDGLDTLPLPEGFYAIFTHWGPASAGPKTYQYIFATWLPASGFIPDSRPHFAIMGEKYKNEDPASEEEIWIPIKRKE
jgi:AraC family transcriptional regulator